jgi:hypothetical protein
MRTMEKYANDDHPPKVDCAPHFVGGVKEWKRLS